MSKFQIRMLAIAAWLTALALAIPPLALHSEWTPYRDGTRVTGNVEHVERSRNGAYYKVDVRYGDDRTTHYPREAPGDTVELIVPTNRAAPILAARLDTKRPSPWLFGMFAGIPILGALGVMLWRAPTRAARRRAARTAPLDAVVDAVRFTRNVSIGLALFFAATAVFLGVIPLFDRTATTWMVIAIECLAVISVGFALWYVWRAVKMRDPRQSPVFELIERRPSELAWFYVHEVRARFGQRGYSLHLWKTDGKLLSLNLVAEDIDAVLDAIARQAPQAKQGYSAELAREYRAMVRR